MFINPNDIIEQVFEGLSASEKEAKRAKLEHAMREASQRDLFLRGLGRPTAVQTRAVNVAEIYRRRKTKALAQTRESHGQRHLYFQCAQMRCLRW